MKLRSFFTWLTSMCEPILKSFWAFSLLVASGAYLFSYIMGPEIKHFCWDGYVSATIGILMLYSLSSAAISIIENLHKK